MMPTILVTVCISTFLNGMLFYIVGYFRLGNLLHYFPRHVILGMTGGFGVFLVLCGLESTTGIVLAENTVTSFVSKITSDAYIQCALIVLFECVCRLIASYELGDTIVPILMFFVPILFHVWLYLFGITFAVAR
jgi:SulP family sulfate permease